MGIYIALSTLTDEGRKNIKNRPERIKEFGCWVSMLYSDLMIL